MMDEPRRQRRLLYEDVWGGTLWEELWEEEEEWLIINKKKVWFIVSTTIVVITSIKWEIIQFVQNTG